MEIIIRAEQLSSAEYRVLTDTRSTDDDLQMPVVARLPIGEYLREAPRSRRRRTGVKIGTMKSVRRLAKKFSAGQLTASEWTHGTRLVLGLWNILSPSGHNAMSAMREGILSCSAALTRSDPSHGYNETLTRFYLSRIEAFVQVASRDLDFMGLVRALLKSPLADPRFHLSCYSQETLQSREAAEGWVSPAVCPSESGVGTVDWSEMLVK